MQIIRKDIYNAVIPVLIAIISGFFPYLLSRLGAEKQWKNARKKSSLDKTIEYFFCMNIAGIGLLVLYVTFFFSVEILFKITHTRVMHFSYILLSIFMYIHFFKKRNEQITLKKWRRHERVVVLCINKATVVLPGILWTLVLSDIAEWIARICFVTIIVFEIILLVIIDDSKEFEFQKAKFYFYNGNTVDNVLTNKIRQERDWIITKNETGDTEYRFRIKDINKVEYTN